MDNPLSSRIPVNIEDEMKRSYMDYAMSVIIGRALPDVRDGLKPAHRRVLYAMRHMGLASNRAYRKCAAVVGEVIGKFHPHGELAVYEALVRLAPGEMTKAPVETRYGFHIICLDRHIQGRQLPFALVRERIAEYVVERAHRTALAQYVARLAAQATITGVELPTQTDLRVH